MTPPLLEYRTTGRNRRTALALAGVWALLALLLVALDAAPWIVAGLALFTLPALWDLLSDRASGLRLTGDDLHWFSGARSGRIPHARIKAVRLDRRLDRSYRVSVARHDTRRIRLPQDCVPPIPMLEAGLARAALPVERHPFSLL